MKKININELIFILILFFPISTILQGIEGFNSINKILTGITILLLLFRNIQVKMKMKNVIILFCSLVVYVFSFVFTKNALDNFNDIFYFALWVLFSLWIRDNYEDFKFYIKSKIDVIYKIVILWNIIVFISLFFSVSYNQNWGNEIYFKSFSNSEHRFAAACMFIFALSWVVAREKGKYKYFAFSILPIISIFSSGARVYLGVVLVFLGCIYYILCKKKSIFYISIVPIAAIGIFLIMLTPMGEKFISISNNGYSDFIAAFSNGRSIFWEADIKAFFELDCLKQLVGNGYNFIYDINEIAIHARIWGHNDVINILLTYGYIGVFIYFYVFISMSKKVLKNMNISKIIVCGYYFIWLFNAMFNMVYTYINATLALPFILYSLAEFENAKKEENKRKNETI